MFHPGKQNHNTTSQKVPAGPVESQQRTKADASAPLARTGRQRATSQIQMDTFMLMHNKQGVEGVYQG